MKQNFFFWPLWVIMGSNTLISNPPFLDPWILPSYRRNSTVYWRLIQSIYSLLENTDCLSPVGYCHLAGIVNVSLKGQSIILSSQQIQDGWKHIKTSEFHKYEPIATFRLLWSDFLDQKNARWNTMMVDRPFCKSTHGTFGRSTAFREGESISRICDYSIKNKAVTHPWWKWSM